jgi:hypothetical protein
LRFKRRHGMILMAIVAIFMLCVIIQNWPGSIFPWVGLAFGVIHSVPGVIVKSPRRLYATAIALIMMGVTFLPLLLGGDALWTRIACSIAYGLTLVLTGWIDHLKLMRIQQSMTEVPDGKPV